MLSNLGSLRRAFARAYEGIRLLGIFIDGVEVSQAIQYRAADKHLDDPNDRGPDDSIRLVADKPAYVRVYVHTLRAPVTGVTGMVTLQRRRWDLDGRRPHPAVPVERHCDGVSRRRGRA